MNAVEQILLKLGIDQSQVAPGLNSFKDKVSEATGHGAKSFLHVESAGRSFKKVIHQLVESSPVLGNALRFAFNPIVGVLLGAVAIFTHFKEQLKETNAELDKMGEENAKPLFKILDIMREIRAATAEANREFSKWLQQINDKAALEKMGRDLHDATAEIKMQHQIEEKRLAVQKEIATQRVHADMASGRIGQGDGLNRLNAIEEGFAKRQRKLEIAATQEEYDLQEAARKKAVKAMGDENNGAWKEVVDRSFAVKNGQSAVPQSRAQVKTLEEALTRAEAARKKFEPDATKADLENPNKWYGYSTRVESEGRVMTFKEIAEKYAGLQKAEADKRKALEKEKDMLQSLTEEERKRKDGLGEAQRKWEAFHEQVKTLTEGTKKLGNQLKVLNETPLAVNKQALQAASSQNLPTIEQLAQSGDWVRGPRGPRWRPGPFAGIANQIEWLQRDALGAAIWDNKPRHDNDMLRVNYLKDVLRSIGIIDPGEIAQKSEGHLEVIAGAVAQGAIRANIVGGVD